MSKESLKIKINEEMVVDEKQEELVDDLADEIKENSVDYGDYALLDKYNLKNILREKYDKCKKEMNVEIWMKRMFGGGKHE